MPAGAVIFLGHFGLGFAGKRVAPTLSLGTLFLAVQFADLLFWILTLLGIEHFRIRPGDTRMTPMEFFDYPISHSLVALLVWGLPIGGAHWVLRRDRVAALAYENLRTSGARAAHRPPPH